VVVVGRDITRQKRAEDALRESEERFRQMAENIQEVFWLFDWVQQRVIYVSPAYEKIWGRSIQALYDRYEEWSESIHPDDVSYAQASFEETLETGGGREREYRIIRPDGTVRWVSDKAFAIFDTQGNVYRITGIATDITKRKEAEKAYRESEERYRLVTERTSDVVSITTFTRNPSYVYASPSHKDVLGFEPEALIGSCPFDFVHPEDRERLIPAMARYVLAKEEGSIIKGEKGPSERMLFRSRDGWGNWRYMEATADLLDTEHVLFVSKDVTARVKMEAELRKSRDELEQRVRERTRELEVKTEHLEEANAALKGLVKMRDRDRKALEESMRYNIKQFAEPYLEKIKRTGLTESQKGYLEIVESTLKDVVSPLLRDLAVKYMKLTPTEIQIANLIKFGKTTKEIAEFLDVSARTVESHRRNIRRKLGIKNGKTTLRSYLSTSQ
jgi:PAS domain S-box-containing protein